MKHPILLLMVLVLVWGTVELLSGGRAEAAAEPVVISPAELALTGSVRQREAAVLAREQKVAVREEELRGWEEEIEEKLDRLTALQEEIRGKLALIQTAEDAEFKNLIRVYGSMKGSKVAPLLNEMEDETAARILKAMKTDQVADIIPRLEPGKAVRVSKVLGMIE